MDKQKLLDRFFSRLIALERRSPLTAETYKLEIKMFLDWLEADGLSLAAGLSSKKTVECSDVSRYLAHRRLCNGIESRTVAKAISALRSFSRFLEDESPDSSAAFASLLEIPRRHDRLPTVHSGMM